METPNTPRRLVRPQKLIELYPDVFTDATLRSWRLRRKGPPFLKIADRIVAYDLDDVERWLAAARRNGPKAAQR